MNNPLLLEREKQFLKLNQEIDNKCKEITAASTAAAKVNSNSVKKIVKNVEKIKSLEPMNPHTIKLSRSCENTVDNIENDTTVAVGLTSNLENDLVCLAKADVSKKSEKIDATSENAAINIVPKSKTNKTTSKMSSTNAQPSNTSFTPRFSRNGPKHNNDTASVVPSKKNISHDGLLKFLKAKVTILQQELELSQKEIDKKTEQHSHCAEAQKKVIALKDQITAKANSLTMQVQKLEDKNAENELKLKEKDIEFAKLTKEFEEAKKEIKQLYHSSVTMEKRLFKSQEDLEYMRKNLAASKGAERELRETNQHDQQFFKDQLKVLGKQRSALIVAYKKQLLLLDNLKRQNLCLEQAKMIQFAEKEFVKILEWNNK